MAESIENKVIAKIKKAKRGSVFFIDDFVSFGAAKAVSKTLERLADSGELLRVSRGIYTRPQISKLLNTTLTPSVETIAKAIARRDRARIVPTGVYALNVLGLSTQIPMKAVYLTDGAARKVAIGKQTILFKKASPKNLATIGEVSSLAIQALKVLGKDKVTSEEQEKIVALLKKEDPNRLLHDIRLAPEWIRTIMKTALNDNITK